MTLREMLLHQPLSLLLLLLPILIKLLSSLICFLGCFRCLGNAACSLVPLLFIPLSLPATSLPLCAAGRELPPALLAAALARRPRKC